MVFQGIGVQPAAPEPFQVVALGTARDAEGAGSEPAVLVAITLGRHLASRFKIAEDPACGAGSDLTTVPAPMTDELTFAITPPGGEQKQEGEHPQLPG